MSIEIILADDHRIMRDGLRALIEHAPDMTVVAEVSDGRSAIEQVKQLSPDVVIMDVGMPTMNGIEATRQLRTEAPEVRVIALSVHGDRQYVAGMLAAGAAGYLLKDCAFEELIQAVRTVVAGKIYLSPVITGVMVDDYVRQAAQGTGEPRAILTPRERQVLQLIAEGHSTKEIGSQLTISIKTVDTHRQKIMEKLNLRTVAELTRYSIQAGLTPLEG